MGQRRRNCTLVRIRGNVNITGKDGCYALATGPVLHALCPLEILGFPLALS